MVAIGAIQTSKGFTLIELVMVIVLIAIVSISAISTFASRSEYVPTIARDTALSAARLAQEAALAMSNTADPSRLEIRHDTSSSDPLWVFEVFKLNQSMQSYQVPVEGMLLINGSALNAGDSHTVTWNQNAFISDSNAREIRIEGANTKRLCISVSGYAYSSESACPL